MKIIKSTKNIKGKYHIKNSTCRNISIKAATNKNSSVRLQMKEELMDQVLKEIKSKLKEVMTSYQFGYDDNEWEDYSGADIYLDNRGYIVITVYAEVSYNGLVKIMDALNPIVEKYDSDAYFDADTPGRCSAYIDPDNVPSNMYRYDNIQNSEKIYSDASNILASSKLTHKKFVNLLKRHFKFSEDAANIVANWYEQDGILDDFDDIDELLNYIDDDIYDMLDASTTEEEYDIVSKYLNTDTNDDREYGEDNNGVENDSSVEDIRRAMNHLPSQFKVTGNNLSYNVAYDSQTVRVAFFLLPGAKYTYTIDGKGPYSTNQEEQINFDLQDYFDRLPVTSSTKNIEDVSAGDNPMSFRYKGRRIKLLTDGTGYAIYEKGEMIDYGFKSLEDAEAAIDEYDDIYQDDVQVYSATEEYDEEELQDIIDELTADGFDVTDEADLLMGLGADLGMDRADARYYAKLILNHMDDSSVFGAEEDEDSLPMVDQEYDSAATSINSNKLPAIYKMVNFNEGDVIVDFGGGKFDNAVEYIRDKGATLCVYDPYNRSAEHNREVLRILRENGGADAAVNSNVLNVIKEPEARKNVLENIARITKPGAPIYITVYEGRGDGQEGPTKSGYQLNRKTADYLEEIQEVFPDATRRGKLITAHNSRVSAATNTANIGAKITCSDVDSDVWVKLAQKQVLDSDGFYTDYTMYSNEDGTSYIFMFGDEDTYGPDPQYADYECSNWDEAAEWWNDYNGFEDDIFEEAIEGASNEVELDPEESMIDVNIDQYIIVDSEGSWDYDSDNYDWASSDGEGSDWYSDNGVRLDDPTGVVEKIDELIEPHVPIEPGTYRVEGYIELYYTVSGVYENRYDYTEDDYSSDINSDFGSAEYNKKLSKIENVKVTKI